MAETIKDTKRSTKVKKSQLELFFIFSGRKLIHFTYYSHKYQIFNYGSGHFSRIIHWCWTAPQSISYSYFPMRKGAWKSNILRFFLIFYELSENQINNFDSGSESLDN